MASSSLEASAKVANLEGSIRQYIADNLTATFSTIDYGSGQPFEDTVLSEWLQVRLLESARPVSMDGPRAPDGLLGRELFVMLNLNIFIRPAKLGTLSTLRLQTLRDTVLVYFRPLTKIRVKDYAGDSATIGNLLMQTIAADRLVMAPTREQELLQWNLTLAFRWSETTAETQ